MILFLHNRYRTTGGEEQAVADLMWLVREHLGEDAELLSGDSGALGRRAAARGLLSGGLAPDEVARAVRRTGARVLHAHNLNPSYGWRALAAARDAGARVVLHLHQYRLVCAVGICFTQGRECTRCHARNTLPGIRHNCRGALAESLLYGTALALWQRRLAAQVDAFVVPSAFAAQRLLELGAPVTGAHVVPHVVRSFIPDPDPDPDPGSGTDRTAARSASANPSGFALMAGRLAPEKGVDVAIEACRLAGVELIVAGDGPERARWPIPLAGVSFTGQVDRVTLAELRRSASLALVPSRSGETFGLAAAEAMAAGLPVAGSRIGALQELLPAAWQADPGDPPALAEVIARVRAQPGARAQALRRAREVCAPEVVAPALAAVYESASEGAGSWGQTGGPAARGPVV